MLGLRASPFGDVVYHERISDKATHVNLACYVPCFSDPATQGCMWHLLQVAHNELDQLEDDGLFEWTDANNKVMSADRIWNNVEPGLMLAKSLIWAWSRIDEIESGLKVVCSCVGGNEVAVTPAQYRKGCGEVVCKAMRVKRNAEPSRARDHITFKCGACKLSGMKTRCGIAGCSAVSEVVADHG